MARRVRFIRNAELVLIPKRTTRIVRNSRTYGPKTSAYCPFSGVRIGNGHRPWFACKGSHPIRREQKSVAKYVHASSKPSESSTKQTPRHHYSVTES